MRTSDITLSIFIILVFVALYFYNILAVGIKKYKTIGQNIDVIQR